MTSKSVSLKDFIEIMSEPVEVTPSMRRYIIDALTDLAERRAGETGDESTKVANLLRALDAKQAKIDALMMEFCPGEMSAEQREEWAKHQQPVSADVERSITEAFARSPRRVDETPRELAPSESASFDKAFAQSPRRVGAWKCVGCASLYDIAAEKCPNCGRGNADFTPLNPDGLPEKSTAPLTISKPPQNIPASASTDDGAPPSRSPTSSVECPKCRTQLAFEGDECGLCKEETT